MSVTSLILFSLGQVANGVLETDVISSSTTIVGYLTVFTDDIFVKCKNGGEKVMPPTASARLSSWVWKLIPTRTLTLLTYVNQS